MQKTIIDNVEEDPLTTLNSIKEKISKTYNISVSISTIDRTLKNHSYTVKKTNGIPERRISDDVKNKRIEYVESISFWRCR